MLATQPYAARCTVREGTQSLIRRTAATVRVNVKTNTVSENFVIGSLNTRAMIRGVSWALASCRAINSAEETNTTNENIADARVIRTVREASGFRSIRQPNVRSQYSVTGAVTSAAAIPTQGRIQT